MFEEINKLIFTETVKAYKNGIKFGFEQGILFSVSELSKMDEPTLAIELLKNCSSLKNNLAFKDLEKEDQEEIKKLVKKENYNN